MVLCLYKILPYRAQSLAEYGHRWSDWSAGVPCPVTEAHCSREESKGKRNKGLTWGEMSQEEPLLEMACRCIDFTQMALQV